MNLYGKLAGRLFLVCFIAALGLALTNNITAPIIAENTRIAAEKATKKVLPNAKEFEQFDADQLAKAIKGADTPDVTAITIGKNENGLVGYAVTFVTKGYGGDYEAMVGVGADGKITGVSMGTNSETPGIGKKTEDPSFYDQFIGKNWDSEIKMVKEGTASGNDVNKITGATISSGAMGTGVNEATKVAKYLFESR